MFKTLAVVTPLLAAILACTGQVQQPNGADGGGAGDTLPVCVWPKSLDKPDTYTTACWATATYLIQGGNACHADEYAVFCGGPGPATPPPLPSGCRPVSAGPGGQNVGC